MVGVEAAVGDQIAQRDRSVPDALITALAPRPRGTTVVERGEVGVSSRRPA
jgi:hypothetical protein